VGVIAGGSLVRATGSGDGCGDTWPRCQGSLFPLGGGTETTIEFAHRAATATLAVVLIWFAFRAWRDTPRGRPPRWYRRPAHALVAWRAPTEGRNLRRALGWVGVFFLGEVIIGAVLVLARWVDQDASIGRVVLVPLHLVNTFLLLGAIALVVHVCHGGTWPRINRDRASNRIGLAIIGIMLVVGASGGLNALADTLFPPNTLLEGIRQELGPAAPLLVRLRALHPVIAIGGGLTVVVALRSPAFDAGGLVRPLANAAAAIVAVEAAIGLVNVALLTPVEIQLVHLVVADVLWILCALAVIRVVAVTTDASRRMESV